MRKGQEGYALVAVLIATTILLTISSLGLSQLKAATRLSRFDRLANDADYQAASGINLAWSEVVTTGYNPGLSGIVDCAGLGEPADSDALFQPDPSLELNHRVWIYRAPNICPDPAEQLYVSIVSKKSQLPPTGYYHFVFTWFDSTSKETTPSPVVTVEIKKDQSPGIFPPDQDPDGTHYFKPDRSEGYFVYYALTTTTDQPPPFSDFRRLVINTDTVGCGLFNMFRCVKVPPDINRPLPPSSNRTIAFKLISSGWAQTSSGTVSKRTIKGSMLPGEETIEYDYGW